VTYLAALQAAQAPAAALRAAEAFKHFQGGAAIFPIVRKGGDKKCYPRCLSALHSLSARLPPVARMGVGNYRIMVGGWALCSLQVVHACTAADWPGADC